MKEKPRTWLVEVLPIDPVGPVRLSDDLVHDWYDATFWAREQVLWKDIFYKTARSNAKRKATGKGLSYQRIPVIKVGREVSTPPCKQQGSAADHPTAYKEHIENLEHQNLEHQVAEHGEQKEQLDKAYNTNSELHFWSFSPFKVPLRKSCGEFPSASMTISLRFALVSN
jgi:hypothetical protein